MNGKVAVLLALVVKLGYPLDERDIEMVTRQTALIGVEFTNKIL